MAVQDLAAQISLLNQPAFGVDEALSEIQTEQQGAPIAHHLARISGVFPPYYDQKAIYEQSDVPGSGALQRIFAKKLIDSNPNEQVFAIAQVYNGFGQYGYFVQTNTRLYFHQCESPKDLHFLLATLQSLGVDDQGNSLDIFGHQLSSPAAPPDTSISCVFDFPIGDKPTAPDTAHLGVDFLIVSIKPANASNIDARLRSRLVSVNSGTIYDAIDIGFYVTQNACRQDSIPLIAGPDGSAGYPPTNSKNAYLAWGGIALVNTWNSIAGPQPAVWSQISPPTVFHNFSYPSGYVSRISDIAGTTSSNQPVAPSGMSPGQRFYSVSGIGGSHWWTVSSNKDNTIGDVFYGYYLANAAGGPTITYPYGGFPNAVNSGAYGISGSDIVQDVQEADQTFPSWQRPYSVSYSYTPYWTFTLETDRINLNPTDTSLVGKRAKVVQDNTYWQLVTAGTTVNYTLLFQSVTDRLNYPAAPTDINVVAKMFNDGSFWKLSNMNRHATKTDSREYYLINLNRLFTDYQNITPASLQFLLRGYWDVRKNGSGAVNIVVTSYKGGLVVRSDSVVWGLSGATQKDTKSYSPVCNRVVGNQLVNSDAIGDNLALITVTMATGIINITVPAPNADGATLCSF